MSKNHPEEIIGGTPYMDEDDKAFLDTWREKLRKAPFQELQEVECIVGTNGDCDLGVVIPPGSTGIGQVLEGDSIYFIFLSQTKDAFLCWICGHLMTVNKRLRALGHVREHHFDHRPFRCKGKIIGTDEKKEDIHCVW